MNFINNLTNELNNEKTFTENGAVAYRTSGKELLDLNFSIASMRHWSEEQIVNKFVNAFYEDKLLAIKWLFYLRDVREGVGERRSFRAILKYLATNHQDIAKELITLVAEYGRWDDLWCLLDTDLKDIVIDYINATLVDDFARKYNNASISLISKWLPSPNASSAETKRLAKII